MEETLERLSDPDATDEDLRRAAGALGTMAEPPSFWTTIADDPRYRPAHRWRAIVHLLRRHLQPGRSTLGDFARLLGGHRCLRMDGIDVVTVLAGKIPVRWTPGDTVFVCRALTDVESGPWALYLRVAGRVSREQFIDLLHGRPVEPGVEAARVVEIGFHPAIEE